MNIPSERHISLSRPLKAQTHQRETTNPPLLLLCSLLTVDSSIPTYVKQVCVCHYFFSSPGGHLALLSPTSLIYHRWTSCNPLTPCLLTVMYKIRCKTDIFWSIFLIHWGFAFGQLSSIWLRQSHKNSHRLGHFLHWWYCRHSVGGNVGQQTEDGNQKHVSQS